MMVAAGDGQSRHVTQRWIAVPGLGLLRRGAAASRADADTLGV